MKAIDPATLPPLEDGLVVRARALVRAAAALRGWLLAPTAEADEVFDPYGAPRPSSAPSATRYTRRWTRW